MNFFDKFYIKLKNDKRLNKKVYEVSQEKKLEYKRISIFLLLPFIISILSIVTLVIISTLINIPFRLPLFIALISISFVLYFIYFYFANKSK